MKFLSSIFILSKKLEILDNFLINYKGCYIGCFGDVILNSKRDLNGLNETSVNTLRGGSIESCLDHCTSSGFIYAGVQAG